MKNSIQKTSSKECTYTKKNGKKPSNMSGTITLAILCSRAFKYDMTICYLFSPHQYKWDMEILDGSVLLLTSVLQGGV